MIEEASLFISWLFISLRLRVIIDSMSTMSKLLQVSVRILGAIGGGTQKPAGGKLDVKAGFGGGKNCGCNAV